MWLNTLPWQRIPHLPESVVAGAATVAAAPLDRTALGVAVLSLVGVFVTAYFTLRSKTVRTSADVRGDTEVENSELKEAATLAFQAAAESRTQASAAIEIMKAANTETVQALREALSSRDEQIRDQRQIISDYRDSLERGSRDHEVTLGRLRAAEQREHDLLRVRQDLERKLSDAQQQVLELTLPPESVAIARARASMHLVPDEEPEQSNA